MVGVSALLLAPRLLQNVTSTLRLASFERSTQIGVNEWAVQHQLPRTARILYDDLAYFDPNRFPNAKLRAVPTWAAIDAYKPDYLVLSQSIYGAPHFQPLIKDQRLNRDDPLDFATGGHSVRVYQDLMAQETFGPTGVPDIDYVGRSRRFRSSTASQTGQRRKSPRSSTGRSAAYGGRSPGCVHRSRSSRGCSHPSRSRDRPSASSGSRNDHNGFVMPNRATRPRRTARTLRNGSCKATSSSLPSTHVPRTSAPSSAVETTPSSTGKRPARGAASSAAPRSVSNGDVNVPRACHGNPEEGTISVFFATFAYNGKGEVYYLATGRAPTLVGHLKVGP